MMAEKTELHLELKRNAPYRYRPTAPLFMSCKGVCALTGNSETLLAALSGSPFRAWKDADITEPFTYRNCLLWQEMWMQNTRLEQPLPFEMLRFTYLLYFRNLSSAVSHGLGFWRKGREMCWALRFIKTSGCGGHCPDILVSSQPD
jgi:hypothetical protein